jgi:hypothetical protein
MSIKSEPVTPTKRQLVAAEDAIYKPEAKKVSVDAVNLLL